MKRGLCAVLSLALLLLSGCAAWQTTPVVTLYYAAETADGVGESLVAKDVEHPTGDPEPGELLALLFSQEPPAGAVDLFAGSALLSCRLEEGVLTVDLSGQYGVLTGLDLSLADACVLKTVFTRFPDLAGVRILAEGQVPQGREDRVYTPGDLDLSLMDLQPVDRGITVWFPDEELRFLQPEQRSVIIRENEEIQRYILGELAAGPREEGHADLLGGLPELVLGVSRDRELCYVNLNGALAEEFHQEFRLEAMTLFSIVQSLCVEEEISQVQFLVDGAPAETFCCVPIGEPITGDPALTGDPDPAAGQEVVTLYYPGPGDLGMVPMSWVVSYREGVGTEQLALEALLETTVPFWSDLVLPRNGAVTGFRIQSGICYVEFSQEFYYNHQGTQAAEKELLDSIVATLTGFDAIHRVQCSVQGLIGASFQYYSLDAPLDGADITYYQFEQP